MKLSTWDHEKGVLDVLELLRPLPIQGHHNEQQPLTVERNPADEEGKHHSNYEEQDFRSYCSAWKNPGFD